MLRFRSLIAVCLLLNLIACAPSGPSASTAEPVAVVNHSTSTPASNAEELATKDTVLAQSAAIHTRSESVPETPSAAEKPVIILVPGFFNSLTPSQYSNDDGWTVYFSAAVINTIVKRGFTVLIADMLAPIGTVAQNGEMLERFLAATSDRFKGRKMILIAHSAGGLYAMYALSKRPSLPVATVITIATPYEGVEFVDHLSDDVPGLEDLVKWLNLDGIRGFKKDLVQEALRNLTVPVGTRWIAVGGTQKPCFMLTCSDSHYLSWVLSIAQKLMSEASDGVVTLSSALGLHTQLRHPDGRQVPMERWADFSFDLEHWKMVEEADLFRVLGVLDIDRIRQQQRQYFNEILDRLMVPPAPAADAAVPH